MTVILPTYALAHGSRIGWLRQGSLPILALFPARLRKSSCAVQERPDVPSVDWSQQSNAWPRAGLLPARLRRRLTESGSPARCFACGPVVILRSLAKRRVASPPVLAR